MFRNTFEWKTFLLFKFRYFKQVLPSKYFTHLKLLAFAMNLAESSVLDLDTIKIIKFLLEEFDRLFSLLYSVSTLSHIHIYLPVEQTSIQSALEF